MMSRTSVVAVFGLLALACCCAALLGGFEDVDVTDEGVQQAAREASRQLSKNFAGKYHHRLHKVVKARQQVVAGMNYKMDMIVGMTTCKKEEMEFDEAQDCEFQDGISTYKKCTIMVYRDLKGNHKLMASGCLLASRNEI